MKRRLTIISLTIISVLLAFAAIYPYSPAGRQSHNLRLAIQHAEKIRPLLNADQRFSELQVGEYTGQGGAIWIIGYIPDDKAAIDLRRVVESTDPPVAVRYSLTVVSELEEEAAR